VSGILCLTIDVTRTVEETPSNLKKKRPPLLRTLLFSEERAGDTSPFVTGCPDRQVLRM
jgi:hypothetical protein